MAGVAAIVVGIGGIVVADQTKLTVSSIFTGGVYIKDTYRVALEFAGIGLIVLGALLTLLASMTIADEGAVGALRTLTVLLTTAVVIGGGLLISAYQHAKAQQAQGSQTTTAASETTTTDATSTDSGSLVANCDLDSNGAPTNKCSYVSNPNGAAGNTLTQPPSGYDAEQGCTWQDRGHNDLNVVEVYICQ